ncbi:thylakoid lumenal 16.5 kDa protein, chloroplastic [Dorcoceras hygrometricum]|nr:thylakoid lumenal 16.5 kDa protein, chloroplastic [Dorcoceras hygrometricum]
MASSLIANNLQVKFDSVLTFPEEGMFKMFKALESTGLRGFLGCPSVLDLLEAAPLCPARLPAPPAMGDTDPRTQKQEKEYEANESAAKSKASLYTTYSQPVDGNHRSVIFRGGHSITRHSSVVIRHDELVGHHSDDSVGPLRHDTSICRSQRGSFSFSQSIIRLNMKFSGQMSQKIHEHRDSFVLLLRVESGRLTVGILTSESSDYSQLAQLSRIRLRYTPGVPNLTLGEANTFPPLNILTMKTVGTYVANNKNITADEDEPVEKMVKKATTKRIPAPAVVEPASKKKRTTMGRVCPAEKDLAMVLVVQNPEPISVVPAVTPRAKRHRALKRKLVLQAVTPRAKRHRALKRKLVLQEPVEMKSMIDVSYITNYDEDSGLKVLSNEEGPLVEMEKEKEKETDKRKSVAKMIDSTDTEPLTRF